MSLLRKRGHNRKAPVGGSSGFSCVGEMRGVFVAESYEMLDRMGSFTEEFRSKGLDP